MFSIIDRYVAKEFLKYFLASLVIFSTLYIAIDMLTTVWQIKAGSAVIWAYYLLEIPTVLYRMLPVSALMATIFTVSILSRSNELTAMFSAGLSLARITAPLLVVTFAFSVMGFFISDKLVPPSTKKRNYIYYVEIKKTPSLYYTIKTNKIWYRSKDLIYNIKTFNPETNTVQGLSIYYFDPAWKLIQLITAKEAHYQGANWILKNGTVTLFAEDSSFPLTENFLEKAITLDERPTDIENVENNAEVMTVNELRQYIKKNKEAALDTVRYEVAYHSKFSFAFVSFVMAFLGIPFSVSKDKSGSFAMNVGITLGIVFVYYILMSVGMSFGARGTLTPVIAAWAPNVMMLGVAIFFLLRLKK
jgi:lipopolysaccharide export system permease protein